MRKVVSTVGFLFPFQPHAKKCPSKKDKPIPGIAFRISADGPLAVWPQAYSSFTHVLNLLIRADISNWLEYYDSACMHRARALLHSSGNGLLCVCVSVVWRMHQVPLIIRIAVASWTGSPTLAMRGVRLRPRRAFFEPTRLCSICSTRCIV